MAASPRQPVLSIPHGGGPCFFIEDSRRIWADLGSFLGEIGPTLPERPKAILVISGHWESDGFRVTGHPKPGLIYDYGGFPPHTYQLKYDVPGSVELARYVVMRLQRAGLSAAIDQERGLDHGVFVPLKVMFPEADIPVVEMSLDRGFDPAQHIAAGEALASLRDRGVLIVGSGMSFHNLGAFGNPAATQASKEFDRWLTETIALDPKARANRLCEWVSAPSARLCHPREEHLLPLMITAGAAEGPGYRNFDGEILRMAVSGYRFD